MRNIVTRYPKTVLLTSAVTLVVLLSAAWTGTGAKPRYHSWGERVVMMVNGSLPVRDNGYFVGSGKCAGCHGVDPVDYANMTEEGVHVSPAENWRATMMANSAKDPFWLAKVAHETAVNPGNAQGLVNKCTSCHAPVGRYSHMFAGFPDYSMELLAEDSLAKDGVNCGACHQQRMEGLGSSFSGELDYHTDTIWGQYVSEEQSFPIFSQAMQSFVGYMPVGDHKVSKSEFCAACHTLITETADLEGNATGGTFIEQATYHEWLNSAYNSEDPLVAQECQGCHMPRLNEPIVIASGYSFLPGREPFGQHWLVGGNAFMLELLKNNIDTLDVTADPGHFDMVIQRTMDFLQQHTATLQLVTDDVGGDTARYTVRITNKAGHKFPSGYPARIAYVEFKVTDAEGNVIFHSGEMDEQFDLPDRDQVYEPHYDVIRNENQVQVYEMVMGDVNGNPTTVLERGAVMLKDNRLVPLGFTTSHAAYDSTQIVGAALADPNFNRSNNVEGSGTDEIHYNIPVSGVNGPIYVTARLMYQSTPPRWMEEMFGFDLPRINHFKEMFQSEGPDPIEVAVAQTTSNVVGVERYSSSRLTLGPIPSKNGTVQVNAGRDIIESIAIYNSAGQLIERRRINLTRTSIELPKASGAYFLEIVTDRKRTVERVVREN